LALKTLCDAIVAELDTTTAVLSEVYAQRDAPRLKLRKTRLRSNLSSSVLERQLPYYPRDARLRSGADLFRLLVADVYGDRPDVAGRELLQNAVDAVRERRRLELSHSWPAVANDPEADGPDVIVELGEIEDERWEMTITDRGVGMTPDTVIDFMLTAGATFGPNAEQVELVSADERPRTLKAGRFGIGAHAAFLLGPCMHVVTRHFTADRGVKFDVDVSGALVELTWTDAPIGTSVTIAFAADGRRRVDELARDVVSWYALDEPSVLLRVNGVDEARPIGTAFIEHDNALRRHVATDACDEVLWCPVPRSYLVAPFIDVPYPATVAHNGFWIAERPRTGDQSAYDWSEALDVEAPAVRIADGGRKIRMTLDRYRLLERTLPFEADLTRAIGRDMVSHAVAVGPSRYPLCNEAPTGCVIYTQDGWLPALRGLPSAVGLDGIVVLRGTEISRISAAQHVPSLSSGWILGVEQGRQAQILETTRSLVTALGDGSSIDIIVVPNRDAYREEHGPAAWKRSRFARVYSGPFRHRPTVRDPEVLIQRYGSRTPLESELVAIARALMTEDRPGVLSYVFDIGAVAPGSLQAQLIRPWVEEIAGVLRDDVSRRIGQEASDTGDPSLDHSRSTADAVSQAASRPFVTVGRSDWWT
jgi:hypothetical protein